MDGVMHPVICPFAHRLRLHLAHWVLLCGFASTIVPLAADADAHEHHVLAAQLGAGEVKISMPHADLVDAAGQAFTFSAEAFGDRVVVIDFVYTTCTTICPALTGVMVNAQQRLGSHLGEDLVLVSVSVDPARDTPETLSTHATRVRASAHWHWLTGRQAQVDRVLRGFGIASGAPDEHPPVLFVGRPADGRWLRWVGIPSPKAVIEATQRMIAAEASDQSTATAIHPTGKPAPLGQVQKEPAP